ncbi:LRR receptor-like serine/threonine-protein kinase GSO1 isoform X1 [Momordica charantia]|nr:LRR receptor-like serine/threonine-protein kinase GSO1 isoform X1 [Momordica charantia]
MNNLNGTVQMQGLERLETLFLHGNKLNNSIFSSMRELTSLRNLLLCCNDLGGIIPTQDIAQLKILEMLDLSHNHYYDGAIPLQDLKNLSVLDLKYNQFNGSMPIQGFCETNSLYELRIQNNHIRGQLSQCVGNFTKLQYLDISSNQFSGKIPTTISNLTSIMYLSLVENDFEGPFLLSSLANSTNLKFLKLSKTQVDTEKSYWVPMFQLEILILKNCELNKKTTSKIPSFLLSQSSLNFIDLSHNQLVGTFPLWLLLNNSGLLVLDLSSNLLTGTLQFPTWKQNLKYLQISDNNFNGELPSNVGLFLPGVSYFNISSNSFEGNLPSSVEQMKDLFYLDTSDNKFSGNLKISIFNNMSHLQCLLLANNNFSGNIEYGWNNSANLVAVDISNNMISGKVPNWIGSLTNLQFLRISKNLFEGELPGGICSLRELRFLDVSQNKLFGVPSCLNSSSLVYLYMQENFLSGHIPQAFSNGSKLKVLDLSYNHFSGPVPDWIHKLTSLRVLLLKMNQLQGSIPRQLCQGEELSIIDFSNNKLSGSIPSCLNNMTFGTIKGSEYSTILKVENPKIPNVGILPTYFGSYHRYSLEEITLNIMGLIEVDFTTKSRFDTYKGNILEYMSGLDLSCNQLTGNIPLEIGDLPQIHALNFSHNKLAGPIPKEISNLKELESLDLSNNFLSGNIPSELAGLNSLAIFNVSYNNLSGMIPTSPHFSTYPASSYYGNSHLCGSYIEQKCSSPILLPDNPSIKLGKEHEAFVDIEAFRWSFVTSYFTILMGFVVVLYINPQWRETWFYFIEDCCSYFCKCI